MRVPSIIDYKVVTPGHQYKNSVLCKEGINNQQTGEFNFNHEQKTTSNISNIAKGDVALP